MKKYSVTYEYHGLLSKYIGDINGISWTDILAYESKVKAGHESLMEVRDAGTIGFFDLPDRTEATQEIIRKAGSKKEGIESCLILGIGGSSLGGKALRDAVKTPLYNLMPAAERNANPRLFFAENIDPETFSGLLDLCSPETTLVVVISKSGGTAETMSQFLIVLDWLKGNLGDFYREHVVAITDPEKGALRKIARNENFETLYIPPNVGGRFSVLTPVGLFPAALIGIDIKALLEGAKAMATRCESPDLEKNPAYLNAVIHYHYDVARHKPLSVLMPYADSLLSLADWYRQLYAESLGKRVDLHGHEVFCGPTPIRALGATDQHSQLQLYMEGPFDKVITFIRVDRYRGEVEIPRPFSYEIPLDYLSDHSLGQLIGYEQFATAHALMENQRPTVTIGVPEINEYTLGQLFYFFELQVAMMGELYGIDVFNQPGVERGKVLTYGLMGRKGYEETVKELHK